ncbi:MFS transporter [Atopomonas sediminilitoris]|uniref:MFS transporter n=1 Tax=Atopomonas sediminilitoris TaxID=2919919 RepID=UPI001F4DBFFD|nr:MFS transporter [Atopomonas sediminilitoris]MCJ8168997.1 MFS transporter [Atopomonas sediminilitoris]
MDALLILGGLLLIVFSMVWLSMQAFAKGLLWGWSTLLPPFNLVYLLAHWRRARRVLLLTGMGAILLVVGLTMLAQRNPERLQQLLAWQWVHPEPAPQPDLMMDLRGEINGHVFRPQSGELIDGVLRLREGGDFFARYEISMQLPDYTGGPLTLDILPNDKDPLPLIEISWQSEGTPLPEFWRLSRGYSLHLNLQPQAPNRLQGEFHLILPREYDTSLSGQVEVYTDHLRYRDGKLDTQHDSMDTLNAVVADYLSRRLLSRTLTLQPLAPLTITDWRAGRFEATVRYQQDGVAASLPIVLQKQVSKGWRVQGDSYPALTDAVPLPVVVETVPEPVVQPIANDRRVGFSLATLLANPARYQGLQVRVVNARGREASGIFDGLDALDYLKVRQVRNDAGEVVFTFSRRDITEIELLEP